jgi:hypothetical protein
MHKRYGRSSAREKMKALTSMTQKMIRSPRSLGKVNVGFSASRGVSMSKGTNGTCSSVKITLAPSRAVIVCRKRACRLNVRSKAHTNQMLSPKTSTLTATQRTDKPAIQMTVKSAASDSAKSDDSKNCDDGKLSGPRRCSSTSTKARIKRSTRTFPLSRDPMIAYAHQDEGER